jgi:competence protein ComEC
MRKLLVLILFSFQLQAALPIEDDAVFIRVIDSGAGLATITRMPGGHYMVYDAGHWFGKDKTMQGIEDVMGTDDTIDLMVISHSDSDHLKAVPDILNKCTVKKIIRGGFERVGTPTWEAANSAMWAAVAAGTLVINLRYFEFPMGATYKLGDTYLTMVSGFHEPPAEWGLTDEGEIHNAPSIVMRLYFKGKSILYAGDAVGRHRKDPVDAIIATEKFMVDNAPVITIDSDVLIAPHHGADNGSSTDFIKEVSPEFVIFSAGHSYQHPYAVTANRYLNNGVSIDNIFRTDIGDHEKDRNGNHKEWTQGRITDHVDPRGDDSVDILIRPTGEILVEYTQPH